ncbi:28258_t:CDS:2, partial [Racocetra persica]
MESEKIKDEVLPQVNVDPKKIGNTTDEELPKVNIDPKEVKNTAILIVGCTGAGKSTLGNWISDSNSFVADSTMGNVTRECQSNSIQIDGREFILVDTPGIFDAMINNAEHISRIENLIDLYINNHQNFEETVRLIKKFLGDGVINHMIVAFSGVIKKQTEDNRIESRLNPSMKEFLKSIKNRWIISPNPDIFNRDDNVVKKNMARTKEMILKFNNAYNLSNFKEARQNESIYIRNREPM